MDVAEAPGPGRDRLTLLTRTLEERRTEREKTQAAIARLIDAEKEAVARGIRESPTQKAYKLGSPAQRARARRQKLESSLESLEVEITELDRIVAEETAAHYTEQIKAATMQARRLSKAELELWRVAGEQLEAVNDTWTEIVKQAEALDELHVSIMQSEAWKLCPDEGAIAGFVEATKAPIQPFDRDFATFLRRLLNVAEGHYERNGVRTDTEGRLGRLVPRFIPCTPHLSGRTNWT